MTVTTAPATYPAPRLDPAPATARDLPVPDRNAHMLYEGTPGGTIRDNGLRAGFATHAVREYAGWCGSRVEEPSTVIGDLLGDLLHLCDALGEDFDALLTVARTMYDDELHGRL